MTNGFRKGLVNLLRSVVISSSMTIPLFFSSCEKENYPPMANLEVSPIKGEVPLNVRMKLTGTDPNGNEDIKQYRLNIGKEVINSNFPIDITRVFQNSGTIQIYGEVIDSENENDKTNINSVEVYGKPFLEQSAKLYNDISIKYTAILSRVPKANLTIKKDGALFLTQNINDVNQSGADYEKTFNNSADGIIKGKYEFSLKSGNLEKKDTLSIPNYKPTVGSIIPVNFLEKTDTTITLPSNFQDKNPEDVSNIQYQKATSLDGKTEATILPGNKLKIKALPNCTGTYQVEIEYGSSTGGLEKTVLEGEIIKDMRMKVNPFVSTNTNGADYDKLKSKAQRDSLVQVKLLEDWDDAYHIFPNLNPVWDCTEYSNQLCINFHGFLDLTGYVGNNKDSIYFYHGTLKDNGKYGLPVYNVIIPTGTRHEMNAILTGNDATKFEDWNFIEPQRDSTNVKPGHLYMPNNCEITINYAYVNESQSGEKSLLYVPILKFKVENEIANFTWENTDPNLNIVKQR